VVFEKPSDVRVGSRSGSNCSIRQGGDMARRGKQNSRIHRRDFLKTSAVSVEMRRIRYRAHS